MADSFDYDRDIAALRRDYLDDAGLTLKDKQRISARIDREVSPINDEIMKLQQRRQSMRSADLSFKSQQMQFREIRRQARANREALSTLPAGQKDLEKIVGLAESGDIEAAQTKLTDFNIQNATSIQHNPAWKSMAAAAEQRLQKITTKRDADKARVMSVLPKVAELGEQHLDAYVEATGLTEDDVAPFRVFGTLHKEEIERKYSDSVRSTALRDGLASINKQLDAARALKPINEDDLARGGTRKQGGVDVPIPPIYDPLTIAGVKQWLTTNGYSMANQTDTEIILQYITRLEEQKEKMLNQVEEPGKISSKATAGVPTP